MIRGGSVSLPPYSNTIYDKLPDALLVITVSLLFHETDTSVVLAPKFMITVSDSVVLALTRVSTLFIVFERQTTCPLSKEADPPCVKYDDCLTPRNFYIYFFVVLNFIFIFAHKIV